MLHVAVTRETEVYFRQTPFSSEETEFSPTKTEAVFA